MIAKKSENERKLALSHPSGGAIIYELKKAGVKEIIALPDIVTSAGLLWPISKDTSFRLTRVCKEDEGVSICGAMSYNGTKAVLMMQQTGLMDSLNAVRAIGVDYQLPIVMIVGLQGKEPHLSPNQSNVYGVRIIEPILNAMEVSFSNIEEPKDVLQIAKAINVAYNCSHPHIFLIGREPEIK